MPSLGPELPPHLQKRKRSIDDSELPNSPPRKLQAAAPPPPRVLGPSLPPTINPDEENIENSDDDDYGPSIRPSKSKGPKSPPRKVIGPSAPPKSTSSSVIGPSPRSKNPDELEIESSDDDDSYGPSTNNKSMAVPPPKRVLGPAPPPASLAERPSYPPNSDSDSDSDYGPSLPPASGSTAAIALENQRAQEAQAAAAKSNESSKPQRPDWMLAPPTSSDWTSKIDPTKLKARKFAGGKGAKAPGEKTGVSAIWTETPEEKRQRLEDAVLGRQESDTSSARTRVETKVDEETDRKVREYNAKNRGKSLYEAHADGSVVAGKGKKEEEDDPSKRGFDREKDMALGGRLGHAKKKELLNRAADFGSRFQKGSYL